MQRQWSHVLSKLWPALPAQANLGFLKSSLVILGAESPRTVTRKMKGKKIIYLSHVPSHLLPHLIHPLSLRLKVLISSHHEQWFTGLSVLG